MSSLEDLLGSPETAAKAAVILDRVEVLRPDVEQLVRLLESEHSVPVVQLPKFDAWEWDGLMKVSLEGQTFDVALSNAESHIEKIRKTIDGMRTMRMCCVSKISFTFLWLQIVL